MDSWGWAGSVKEFLSLTEEQWFRSLSEHHERLLNCPPSGSQTEAWRQEFEVMGSSLRQILQATPTATAWSLVFEYELPLEGGRRPDVVVMAGGTVVVLEFKSVVVPLPSQIDQVTAYARDLADYHEATHGRSVASVLVLPNAGDRALRVKDIAVTGPSGLAAYLVEYETEGAIDLQEWLSAPYAPLPTLVEAARRIFSDEPLPHVKTALAEGIPETLDLIEELIHSARQDEKRLMIFVTGVPGAGKTLVGLRLVYERAGAGEQATFLSGNGPLVQVLQDALKSRAFVRDLHAFIKTYGLSEKIPRERMIVFDEAQRAWDAGFMNYKHGLARSEPELLVAAAEKVEGWSTLVGLVGEGQEIHSGEEGGMAQWGRALTSASTQAWDVHCPDKLREEFNQHSCTTHPELDLTASLRSRRAQELHDWVAHLLRGSLSLAARIASHIQDRALFPMYLTRDLDEAKEYAKQRYQGEPAKRYGLLASSHAKNLKPLGIDNSFMATSRMNVARWFNAEPDDSRSGCQLVQPITEFQCQGLEIDLPLICWGSDLRWDGSKWNYRAVNRKYRLENPEQILTNTYRVLLTRGRDGVLIFIPPGTSEDATELGLLAAGVRPLPPDFRAALPRTAEA